MKILTANRLREGDVVYWGGDGWKTSIDQATVVTDIDGTQAIASIGSYEEAANRVVDTYLIDVSVEAKNVKPKHYREVIRSSGPSVRIDLGKQALLPA